MFEEIKEAMQELDEEQLLELVEKAVAAGEVQDALKACQEGMEEVGRRFEAGEYFVGDLIFAGEIMVGAMDIMKPVLAGGGDGAQYGKMILCTVKDDLHDIGKNIVKAMLEAGGFEVLDLGIDVPAAKIVETAKAENIKIVALSGVLTLALDSMKTTIQAFRDAGMDDVKIIIGGCPVTEEAAKSMGADEWAYSPQKTVNVCQSWAKGQ